MKITFNKEDKNLKELLQYKTINLKSTKRLYHLELHTNTENKPLKSFNIKGAIFADEKYCFIFNDGKFIKNYYIVEDKELKLYKTKNNKNKHIEFLNERVKEYETHFKLWKEKPELKSSYNYELIEQRHKDTLQELKELGETK